VQAEADRDAALRERGEAKERKNRELNRGRQAPERTTTIPSDEDGVVVDYQIEFCRDLPAAGELDRDRRQQLQQAKPFVEQRRPGSRRRCARRSRPWA